MNVWGVEFFRGGGVGRGAFSCFFFSLPVYTYFCPSFLSINNRTPDPGSHGRVSFPLPTVFHAFHFCRETTPALSSLVSLSVTAHRQPFCPDFQDMIPTYCILFFAMFIGNVMRQAVYY